MKRVSNTCPGTTYTSFPYFCVLWEKMNYKSFELITLQLVTLGKKGNRPTLHESEAAVLYSLVVLKGAKRVDGSRFRSKCKRRIYEMKM